MANHQCDKQLEMMIVERKPSIKEPSTCCKIKTTSLGNSKIKYVLWEKKTTKGTLMVVVVTQKIILDTKLFFKAHLN